ncbi:MAG: DJ-1/PfpI family protein [Methyloglobulus sp.]|nr:DJ-1/PfpI family protein [Methyloglobulus sp.]
MYNTQILRKNLQKRGVILLISLFSLNVFAFDAGGDSHTTVVNPLATKTSGGSQKPDLITNMDELMARQPNPNVNVNGVGIYVYDGMFSLDALGPYQVFKSAGLKTFLIAKNKGTVTMSNGLTLAVNKSIAEVSKLDVLLIPGGAGATAMQTIDPEVLDWIKKIDETSIYTTSVCTGAWILGATGLLQGKDASTHWYRANEMLTKYGAEYTGKRWTVDGKYWTSAGVTGGVDMALALVNHLFGKQYTQAVMLDMEYDPKPPVQGGSPKKSDPIIAQLMKDMYDFFLINFVNCPLGTPGACLFN